MTKRLDDGYQTLVAFAAAATVKFWEKEVTPPGMEGGGAVDTTTMLNTTYRTQNPKALVTLAPASMEVAYDPAVYPQILTLINVNNLITVTFPDGDTLAFWGWLDEFKPGACKEGEQPTATVTIIPSNQNAAGAETPPVHTPAP